VRGNFVGLLRNDYRNIKRRTIDDRDELVPYDVGRTDQLASQLAEMTRKQKELEQVIKHLVADNQSLRTENGKLWKRVEKNIEKSDKKVEKLMLFMLFGNQPMQEADDGRTTNINEVMVGSDVKLEIEDDPNQKTPKEALAKNLISMLKNQRES
jgi:regulator of replication initiation timing